MGDRVLMQIVNKEGEFSPVVYGHWCGTEAPKIAEALIARMKERAGDVSYWGARLIQEVLVFETDPSHSLGMWNTDSVLTADDSHGDAGCVIINSSTMEVQYVGGYFGANGANGNFGE